MPNLQSVTIIGHTGKDAELQFTPAGKPLMKFSVAVSESKNVGGEWKSETTWFNVSQFGDAAERNVDTITKGIPVFVQGKLQVRTYERKDGGTGVDIGLLADKVIPLVGKGERASKPARAEQEAFDDLPFE